MMTTMKTSTTTRSTNDDYGENDYDDDYVAEDDYEGDLGRLR